MRHWQRARQGLQSLFLVAVILMSCSAPGGDNPAEGCGGTEASVSCLEISSIAPTGGSEGGNASNVDAFQEICVDPVTGGQLSSEIFTDHPAEATFTNRLFPTAQTGSGFDFRITGYSVSYRVNQCPAAALGCPPLTGFTVSGQNILIAHRSDGQPASVTVPLLFVPLRVKNEFCAAGGERGRVVPSYLATYTFTAQTSRLNDTFTLTGSTEFTIGDFITGTFSCPAPGLVFLAPCRR